MATAQVWVFTVGKVKPTENISDARWAAMVSQLIRQDYEDRKTRKEKPMLEYCCECDEPTERAGRADDSIYVELLRDWHRGGGDGPIEPAGTEIGPLCLSCYVAMRDEGLVEA